MFRSIYNYTKLFLWSGITYIDYKFNNKLNILLVDILLYNIQSTSSLGIKCIQKAIPYLKMIDIDKDIINVLENVYENNIYHSDQYTKYIYNKDFLDNFDNKYIILDTISSGSIGQVYKVKNIYTNKIYALKVKHPNIDNDIYMINFIVWLFNLSKFTFFELDVFINNFVNECNFINESDNMIKFYEYYKDNYKIIIPNIYEHSENIIVMDYYDGENISLLEEYNKIKYMILIVLFCNNNKLVLNFNHGDLHFGNFKKNEDKLVVYDFGYCFTINEKMLIEITNVIYHHLLKRKNLKYSYEYCINYIVKYHLDENDDINNYKNDIKEIFLDSPINLISDIVNKCYIFFSKNGIKIKIEFLNLLLNYYLISEHNTTNLLDIISYCETYNIFTDYVKLLKEEDIQLYRNCEKIEYYNKELADELKKLM